MLPIKLKYGKYPRLVRTLEDRHIRYNETLSYIEEKENRGELFVIRPECPLPVDKVEKDPLKLKKAYEIGRITAEKYLPQIIAFLDAQS